MADTPGDHPHNEENVPDIEVNDTIPSGLKVSADQPYRALLVTSLTGSSEHVTLNGPLNTQVTPVDATRFDDFMRDASPTLTFSLDDPMGGPPASLTLSFESIKDFHPDSLIAGTALLSSIQSVRVACVERLHGKIKAEDLQTAVDTVINADERYAWIRKSLSWKPQTASSDKQIDDVLASLDLGDDAGDDNAAHDRSAVSDAVARAARDENTPSPDEVAGIRRAVAEIDRRLTAWITAILHAPEFQSIEQAWRSLAFLVSHVEFRKGVRLTVLHAAPAQRLPRFIELLIDPVFDEGADAPDVVLVDHNFGGQAPDYEALEELSQNAASIPCIVIAGVGPGFFGVKHAWQIATLPSIPNMFDQWQFAKWKSRRNALESQALGVIFGRGMLRAPYEPREGDELAFRYREQTVGEKDFLWCSGAVGAGVTILRSVTDIGWPTAMAGMINGNVEGFATGTGGKRGDKEFGPTDTRLPQAKIDELGAIGVNALVAPPDEADAVVWNGLSALRPAQLDPNALLEVSLPYRLFASRISNLLFELKPSLEGIGAEAVEKTVKTHVAQWLGLGSTPETDDLNILTRQAEDDPGKIELAVTVKPPQSILPAGIPVVMGYRVSA